MLNPVETELERLLSVHRLVKKVFIFTRACLLACEGLLSEYTQFLSHSLVTGVLGSLLNLNWPQVCV